MSANLLANGGLLLRALLAKLNALRERHARDPLAYARAARTLHKQHDITSGLGGGLLVFAVRTPLGIGIYAAIRQSGGRRRFVPVDSVAGAAGFPACLGGRRAHLCCDHAESGHANTDRDADRCRCWSRS